MWKTIIAPAVVVSLFWLIVGGATSYYLTWQSREIDRILDENFASIRTANELQETVWRMQSAVALATDGALPTEIAFDVTEDSRVQKSLQAAEVAAKTLPEKSLVRSIRKQFSIYRENWLNAKSPAKSTQISARELLAQALTVVAPCEELVRLNDALIHETSRRRQQLTNWVIWGRATMLLVGPGLGLLIGFRLAGQLGRSITNISVSLQSVAGDLEHEIGKLEVIPNADLPSVQRQLNVISDRMRHVVTELHQARRDALRTERLAAVGELAAGVAHELRNPLTSVKLLIQTMQHRLKPDMPEETFDIVLEEITRMETTIQGLLDFARPPTLNRARQDIRLIVQRAVNLTEGKAQQSGVAVVTDYDADPVWVNSDAEQLHQVCVNLLLNGIESMANGGRLNIQVATDPAAELARITFEDTGLGIPEQVLPRLFEPFVTSKDHGTGLGLAISRRIVSNHSGQLTAENRDGGGAVLTVELPLDNVHSLSGAPCAP